MTDAAVDTSLARHAVFAHGFTQTGRSWDLVSDRFCGRCPAWTTTAVDLPGHGDAGDFGGDLWAAADLLVRQGGTGSYVGYSMGGRVALHAALAHPDAVERLVLIGATAGIDDDAERAARRSADEALADRILEIGVPNFVDEWLDNDLFAGLSRDAAQREDRLRNSAEGLASSLRDAGTGTQEPLWARLGEIAAPTLVLVGAHDAKFTALGHRLVDGLRDGHLVSIPGAGHSVHLERPDATVDALVEFLCDA